MEDLVEKSWSKLLGAQMGRVAAKNEHEIVVVVFSVPSGLYKPLCFFYWQIVPISALNFKVHHAESEEESEDELDESNETLHSLFEAAKYGARDAPTCTLDILGFRGTSSKTMGSFGVYI